MREARCKALDSWKECGLWRRNAAGGVEYPRQAPLLATPYMGLRILSHITDDQLKQMHVKAWEGKTHVIKSIPEANDAIQLLMSEELTGFDVEFKPSFTKGYVSPPALVQVSALSACHQEWQHALFL